MTRRSTIHEERRTVSGIRRPLEASTAFAPLLGQSALSGPRSKAGRKVHMLTLLPTKSTPFVDAQAGLTLAQAIVDTVRDPLVVLDQDLRVLAAGRSFLQTFGLKSSDVQGCLIYEIDGG